MGKASASRFYFLATGLIVCTGICAQVDTPANQQPASGSAVQAEIPLELLTARPPMSAPVLSPNGDRIAARVTSDDRQIVATMKLFDKDDGVKRGLRPVLVLKDAPVNFAWISNDLLLVQSFGLLVHNVVTEQQRVLNVKSAVILSVNHVDRDGKYVLVSVRKFGRGFVSVHRIDIDTGDTTEVQEAVSPISAWFADSNGVIRLGSGRVGQNVKFVYRENAGEKFTEVAKFRWKDMDADLENIRFRGGRADRGLIVSNVKTGRFAVYEFDWKTFDIGAAVFEHPQVDVERVWFKTNGDPVAAAYTDDKPRVAWLDPAMKDVQAEIDKALGGRSNLVVSMDDSQTKFIVWTSVPEDPGHYYYFNRQAGVMKRIASVLEGLNGQTLAPMQTVSYTSRDGLTIPAYLTIPANTSPQKLPLIVMPHGGPHARDTWHYDSNVQFLASRGYAVLQPNFRGSSGYGKDYLKMGYGQWGGAMQDDLTDGVRWLVAEGIVDPSRVCIMGSSYGGYAALMGAIKTPEVFRCAISFAGVTNVDKLLTQDPYWSIPSRYGRLKEKLEGDQELNLKSVSPAKLADQAGVPILLAHGRRDFRVRYSQAEDMVRALKRADKEFEFVEFKEAGHGFQKVEDHNRYLQAVEAFLKKYNPSDRMLAAAK
jgi:dipeptidyl aminopeptidase/acylaminoacyl peptidase